MANPLRVLTELQVSGALNTSGSLSVGGNGSLTVANGATITAGGLTVSSGVTSVGALTASSALLTTADINGGTIDGATIATSDITVGAGKTLNVSAGTLTLAAGQVGADRVSAGTFAAGTYSFAGSTISAANAITASNLSVSSEAAVGSLTVGGGYGSTGVSVSATGNIQADGTLTVGSTSTLTGDVTFGGNIVADANEAKSIFAAVTSNTITVGAAGATVSIPGTGSIGGNLTVAGNLTVNGTTTTVDTQNLLVEDAVIQIGSGSAGNANGDRGLIFSRNSENKAFFWDESDSKFKLAATTTEGNTNTIVPGTAQALDVGALSATSVVASSGLTVTGSSTLNGAVLFKTDTDFGFGTGSLVNLSGTFAAFAEQLNSLDSNNLVLRSVYSGVRSYSYAGKGAGSSVQFLLSGSAYTGTGTAAVTASCPTKLSGSSSGAVLNALRYASFDVATKDQGATVWTNDLVSVQIAATQPGGSGLYFPLVTVDAPALTSGAEIRLIVVNEATAEFM